MTEQYCIDRAHVQALSDKVDTLTAWMGEHAPFCEASQKHLDPGTPEQAYWHYGYLSGTRDVLKLIRQASRE
jgi:hypothetical protein